MEEKRICLYCKHYIEFRDTFSVRKYGENTGHCIYNDGIEKNVHEKDFIVVKFDSSCDQFDSIFPKIDKNKDKNSKRE